MSHPFLFGLATNSITSLIRKLARRHVFFRVFVPTGGIGPSNFIRCKFVNWRAPTCLRPKSRGALGGLPRAVLAVLAPKVHATFTCAYGFLAPPKPLIRYTSRHAGAEGLPDATFIDILAPEASRNGPLTIWRYVSRHWHRSAHFYTELLNMSSTESPRVV